MGAADLSDGVVRDPINGNLPNSDDTNGLVTDMYPVRIISAIINPQGKDVGYEVVTLVNVAPTEMVITNWSLRDKNDRAYVIEDKILKAGEFFSIRLPRDNVQLSNKGGEIRLHDDQQKLVHRVSYSKTQARRQGVTVLF